MNNRLRLFFLLLFPLFSTHIWSQISFTARADASKVVENGVFSISFTLENAQGSNFSPPDFENFDVLNGPSVSQSTTIINGQGSSSIDYTYSLMARKQGAYTIGSASIQVKGKSMKSNPVTIQVVKNNGQNIQNGMVMPTDEDIFVRAEIDSTTFHPGQQIILNYRIYTNVNIREFTTLSEDKYDNFYFQYLRNFNRKASQVVINGKQFTTQLIKTVALFPQKTGVYDIQPMSLNVWLPKPGQTSRSFFSRSSTINKRITSNPVKIEVDPLPDGAPESFSGAIGQYAMRPSVNLKTMTTDDALVLELTVKGTGDSKRWTAPDLGLDDMFEVYEPNTTYDESEDENGMIANLKKFEYLMIPRKTGNLTFRVPFSFYNPDSLKYQTLISAPIRVAVAPGVKRDISSIEDLQAKANDEIGPLMHIKGLSKGGGTFLFSPLYFILGLLPILFTGFIWYKHKDDGLLDLLDPTERKRRVANEKALRRLSEAKSLLDAGASKEFYDSISKSIYGYISDKLKIPISVLSKETVSLRIGELEVASSRKDELMSILQTCERNVYGGVREGAKSELYDQTLALITTLEAAIGAD